MARAGMTDIITKLRTQASAFSTGDLINGVQYWTDDQLEDVLDVFSQDLNDVQLVALSQVVNGVTTYKVYYLPETTPRDIEGSATAGAFTVVDSTGITVTGYTFDLARRRFDFTDNQNGNVRMLRARAFDVNAATAEVWLRKAGLRADLIDWKAGTYNLKEDQEYQHCLQMYAKWAGKATFKRIQLNRVDYNANSGL